MRHGIVVALILTLAAATVTAAPSAGDYCRIYDPSAGESQPWYVNDHCFVRDRDGLWHLFGITHAEPMNPLDEDHLAHATADSLARNQWEKQPFALSVDPNCGEEHLWAPHVILHGDTYYMYYCAGDKDHTRYKIHLATSKDLRTWNRHAANPVVVDGYDARDPFILRLADRWVMYYTATDDPSGGHHVVAARTSQDLIHWSGRTVIFLDDSRGTYGGPTESPFVVRRGPWYYLFIGPRGGYVGTDIFRSRDPLAFAPQDRVGHVNSHAAEVVRDVDGRWFVSHCGWGQGGVYLAPLSFDDGLDDADTSLTPGH